MGSTVPSIGKGSMMHEHNPFQELYVTDSPDLKAFVRLFSDVPVHDAAPMFRPGNVVLKGTQGAGKSMLLNLLRPEVRLAYWQARERAHPFPVKESRFIGAGINLTKSGILDFGQRPVSNNAEHERAVLPLYFADFLNYFIVRDILDSVFLAAQHQEAFDSMVHSELFDDFAVAVCQQDCWFGALEGVASMTDLTAAIDTRISSYRKFHNFILKSIPPRIDATRSTIGEPISRVAELLRMSGVLDDDVEIFVRIDQVERFSRSDVIRRDLGREYRRMVNKALGLRDARVSYRIGTRQHAWEDDLTIYGTADQLEKLRDYRVIDLDANMRRGEDTKTWVFPRFAEDVMKRRLRQAGHESAEETDTLRFVFGSSPKPHDVAAAYVGKKNASPQRAIRPDPAWPDMWRRKLEELFEENPLSAVLAAAWLRQKKPCSSEGDAALEGTSAPWDSPYWKKERVRQALTQLAARTSQRPKWWGKEHILQLSGGNITIFLSICHEVWDAALRSYRRVETRLFGEMPINRDVQAVGIQTASDYWYDKIPEQPCGADRQRFMDVLGSQFKTWLLEDDTLSYPGRNGFSLAQSDLDSVPALKSFLSDASDYGDLVAVRHTTKERDRRRRTKWYLNPILSPHYQIPESHVKEPAYLSTDAILDWLSDASVLLGNGVQVAHSQRGKGRRKAHRRQSQEDSPSLFDVD